MADTYDYWGKAKHNYDGPLPDETTSPGGHRRSWLPVDLEPVLTGTWHPPVPSIGSRTDKAGLFYPTKVHTISSESEGGKTWLALAASIDELAAGSHVVYIDFEDDEGGVVGRLLTLQANLDTIREGFHYLKPDDPLGTGLNVDDLTITLTEYNPSLVIIDGITEAMTLHRLNILDNKDCRGPGHVRGRMVAW